MFFLESGPMKPTTIATARPVPAGARRSLASHAVKYRFSKTSYSYLRMEFTRANSLSISAHVSQCGNARMRCNEIVKLQRDRLPPSFEPHLLSIEQERLVPGRWPTICSFLGSRDLSNGDPCGLNVAT